MILVILKYLAFLGLYVSLCHSAESRQSILPLNFVDAMSSLNSRIKYLNENHVGMHSYSNFELLPLAERLGKTDFSQLKLEFQNVSEPCLETMLNFVNAVNTREPWVFEVLDAFGKPGSGILQGNLLLTGEYIECLNTSAVTRGWQGKYCSFGAPLATFGSISFEYGMCVPDKCSNTDLAQMINFALELLQPLVHKKIKPVVPEEVTCHAPKSIDTKAIIAITIVSFIISLVLLGTIYDVYKQYRQTLSVKEQTNVSIDENGEEKNSHEEITSLIPSEAYKEPLALRVLSTFSAYTNTKKIFNVVENGDQLTCLHAIRHLSFGWVMLGHTFVFGLNTIDNIAMTADMFKRFSFQLITSAVYSVDSFFMLSGLLTSYIFLKEVNKPGVQLTFGLVIKYYLHRIWRLTPAYMAVLMMSATLTRYLGDGPFFPVNGFELNFCQTSWWTNLLYVNNFVNFDQMCLPVSWYLANDMQFHWIAPLFLIPMAYGKVILGTFVAIALLVTHILSNALILNANPGMEAGFFSVDMLSFTRVIYMKPWTRIGPFAVGLLVGYLIFLHKRNPQKVKLNRITNTIGWLLSLVSLGLVVFGLYPDFQGNMLSKATHIIYHSFSAIVWAIGLGFIILSCVTGYGGIINKFLSFKFWTPLSRLTYAAYLIHPAVLLYYHATLEHPFHLQDQAIAYMYISHLVLSYTAAIFISILFEIPMICLEKFVFRSN